MTEKTENANADDWSFDCPNCGDWLPTQKSYDFFRGKMNIAHTCYCGTTSVHDAANGAHG